MEAGDFDRQSSGYEASGFDRPVPPVDFGEGFPDGGDPVDDSLDPSHAGRGVGDELEGAWSTLLPGGTEPGIGSQVPGGEEAATEGGHLMGGHAGKGETLGALVDRAMHGEDGPAIIIDSGKGYDPGAEQDDTAASGVDGLPDAAHVFGAVGDDLAAEEPGDFLVLEEYGSPFPSGLGELKTTGDYLKAGAYDGAGGLTDTELDKLQGGAGDGPVIIDLDKPGNYSARIAELLGRTDEPDMPIHHVQPGEEVSPPDPYTRGYYHQIREALEGGFPTLEPDANRLLQRYLGEALEDIRKRVEGKKDNDDQIE